MSKLAKRHFWDWFQRHQHEYRELLKQPKKEVMYRLRELDAHLRAYYKFLGYSLSSPNQGMAKLTITVYGKAKYFKQVEAFVATAPVIPGWSIQALEDAMPADFLLDKQIGQLGIDPLECSFSFKDGDQEIIVVYHPLCTDNNSAAFLQLAFAAVYNLLGERSYGLQIDTVEVDNLSCADLSSLHPLEELPLHIISHSSCMAVDGSGLLMNRD
ncbi:hypothetical protein [Paraflavitalea pollutisoli]|uniref:hypothetical protein n=1 Tax=Paraflavitalea pollutisoli TaxID=3034143 RepID=UPI0023EADB3C|nr:hypothetical protein [Paraflavitalea sp. H1-2-19X]